MSKQHISFWIEEKDLKECDANVIISDYDSRSVYIAEAVRFYNGYIHNKNNEEYVNTMIRDNLTGMMKKFERRTAKLLFKRTDGRWGGVVWYMDEQGNRKRKSFSGTTKQEANKKITTYIAEFENFTVL